MNKNIFGEPITDLAARAIRHEVESNCLYHKFSDVFKLTVQHDDNYSADEYVLHNWNVVANTAHRVDLFGVHKKDYSGPWVVKYSVPLYVVENQDYEIWIKDPAHMESVRWKGQT